MQDALQKNRTDDVKLRPGYDAKIFREIARHCGTPSLLKETEYIRTAKFYAPKKFVSEMIGDYAFFAGTIGKNHFRLIEIAVRKEKQGQGLGKLMMRRIITICRKNHLEKITLRTNRNEHAVDFYRKYGGTITAINGNDYEMEIRVCFTSS